jgi:hypothetical protein
MSECRRASERRSPAAFVGATRPRATALAPRSARATPIADTGHAHDDGRSWQEIRALLGRAKLAAPVRERALAIFEGLAESEARVHGLPIDRVHFTRSARSMRSSTSPARRSASIASA